MPKTTFTVRRLLMMGDSIVFFIWKQLDKLRSEVKKLQEGTRMKELQLE